MKKNKYFILFGNCIPVKGHLSSIILDLQRESYLEIPNMLFDILMHDLYNLTINQLKLIHKNQYSAGIDAYFNYLCEMEYGFFTNEPKFFPKIKLAHESPFKLLSSVINYNENSNYQLENVFKQLAILNVQTLQIRIFKNTNINELLVKLKIFKASRTKKIEIYLKDYDYDLNKLINVTKNELRISIIIHSSSNYLDYIENRIFIRQEKIYENGIEIYSPDLFISNIPFFCEANFFNIGLNRKISIDFDGSIKNYISHKKIFGNINNTLIDKVLESEEFQEKWNISNDIIEKCKDCQFRYSCLSNSDVEKTDTEYKKINTCNFDPYTNTWNNQTIK